MTSKELFTIEKIIAREVFDSRGNPTIEVEIYTDSKHKARAIVPSGASTGTNEALELRDKDKNRFHGKGVLSAIKNTQEKILPILKGKDVRDIKNLDKLMLELDGTPNKSKLGANATLGVSLASCKLAAMLEGVPLYEQLYNLAYNKKATKYLLPVPMANVINGGSHAGGNLAPQEFMIMPLGFKDLREAMRSLSEI